MVISLLTQADQIVVGLHLLKKQTGFKCFEKIIYKCPESAQKGSVLNLLEFLLEIFQNGTVAPKGNGFHSTRY